MGGRLSNSTFGCKLHPMLISSKHPLFKSEHNRLMQAGPQLLLATREIYWPIADRNLAKVVKMSPMFKGSPLLCSADNE